MRVKLQPLNVRTLKYWSDRLPAPAYDRDLVMPQWQEFKEALGGLLREVSAGQDGSPWAGRQPGSGTGTRRL